MPIYLFPLGKKLFRSSKLSRTRARSKVYLHNILITIVETFCFSCTIISPYLGLFYGPFTSRGFCSSSVTYLRYGSRRKLFVSRHDTKFVQAKYMYRNHINSYLNLDDSEFNAVTLKSSNTSVITSQITSPLLCRVCFFLFPCKVT